MKRFYHFMPNEDEIIDRLYESCHYTPLNFLSNLRAKGIVKALEIDKEMTCARHNPDLRKLKKMYMEESKDFRRQVRLGANSGLYRPTTMGEDIRFRHIKKESKRLHDRLKVFYQE